jgi:hypothetical protein
LRFPWSWI